MTEPKDPTSQARELVADIHELGTLKWPEAVKLADAALTAARAEGTREAQQHIAKRIAHLEFTHGTNNGYTDGSYDYDMEVAAALFELRNLEKLLS